MRWIGIGKWGRNGALLEMKQDNDLFFSAERMTSMTDEFCLFLPARFLCRGPFLESQNLGGKQSVLWGIRK